MPGAVYGVVEVVWFEVPWEGMWWCLFILAEFDSLLGEGVVYGILFSSAME